MILLAAALSVSALVLIYVLLKWLQFPSLPGPGWLQYLPGGEVYPMLKDSRESMRTVLSLAEKYGDVFFLWAGPTPTIVCSSPADIRYIMTAIDDFPRPPGMQALFDAVIPGGLMSMPKDIHAIARRKLRGNFNFSLLQNFHGQMLQAVDELCTHLSSLASKSDFSQPSQVVDISERLSIATFCIITNIAFGCKMTREERIDFSKTADELIDEMLLDLLGYPIRQALSIFGTRKRLLGCKKKLDAVCHDFIQKRLGESLEEKKARPEDLLDAILTLDKNDLVTLTSQTLEFAVAGSHTTAQMLAWCIFELSSSPRVMAEVDKEIETKFGSRPLEEPVLPDDLDSLEYLKKVWKEVCRMHPAGPFFMRVASKRVTLPGSDVVVPKGGTVLAFAHRAHRHPNIWSEPDVFKPERWGSDSDRREGDKVPAGANIPFSIGPRNCAGRFLADYEGLLILAELYRRFKLTLACDPHSVISSSGWVENPRFASGASKDLDMGVPVRIELRN